MDQRVKALAVDEAARKREEREFHDALRASTAARETPPANRKYYEVGRANDHFFREWLKNAVPGRRVLDYCSGDGRNAMLAATLGASEVRAIDISAESLRVARDETVKKGLDGKIAFEVADAERLPYQADYFDVVVVAGVLHHLDLACAYSELARVLKPGGVVICTEALRHNPVIHLYRRWTPALRTAWEVDHILGRRDIVQARNYFDDVRIERFFHLATLASMLFRATPLFSVVLRVGEISDGILLRIPYLQWYAWLAVFTLRRPKKRVR